MKNQNTIVAIATPCGNGGVGVIRLSGPDAKRILKEVWKSEKKIVDNFASHRLYLGIIVDSSGKFIDKGLGVWMRAPHSYTGEEVVEIHGHGSPFLLDKILQACLDAGARLAEPGEFTKRAYLNGKMDLAQAEAVADVIAASSEMALLQAREHLSGQFSKKIAEFQEELVRLRAFVEASIDFPEEDIEFIQKEGILARMQPIQVALSEFLGTYHEGRLYREGIKTVLVGRPNVGKSSLLNALIGIDRAIVHHQPGTTRDVIEEVCQFFGVAFRLFDTAGLREASDEVEAIGVERSRQSLENADLILWILDGSSPLSNEDIDFLSHLNLSKTIICINKTDLGLQWNPKSLILDAEKDFFELISAKNGQGLNELRAKMVAWVKKKTGQKEGGSLRVTKLRHKEALEGACKELSETATTLPKKGGAELLAVHLKKAHEYLGVITGSDVTEELLNSIFSEFCIGK